MKNLRAKPFAFVIFVVFAASFVAIAYQSGKTVNDLWTALAIAYKTIPVIVGAGGLFVAHAWRWRIFRGWLVPFPNLNGTWQGTIQSTWKNPETGETPGPIPAILTIKQSFIRMSCVIRTAEMTSRSYLADFWLDSNEQIRKLGYSYNSAPLPSVVHRSQPHDGTMVFEIVGSPVEKLKGTYRTSRQTTGEVVLTFRERKLLEEFPSDLGTHPMSRKAEK
jgi:predicted pore-forming effector associated with SMODS systems